MKQAVLNRNLTVTGIPYSRCHVWLLPLSALTFVLYFITYAVITLPISFLFKLFGHPLDLTSPFSRNTPERTIPRLYLPIERFYKYTFRNLPYCPEQNAYASEILEKYRSKWRVEMKDKTFESEYVAKRFAEAMKLPLPEREDNRRMMTDKEKISAVHPHWNEITFSSFGCFVQGLTRVEIPTDQLQVLFPLALTQTENKSFSETLEELDYVSPYMLVMKDVIEELKISKTTQPVKKIVEHAVIEIGNKRNIEISQRFAEYIAQAIRLTEAPQKKRGGAHPSCPKQKSEFFVSGGFPLIFDLARKEASAYPTEIGFHTTYKTLGKLATIGGGSKFHKFGTKSVLYAIKDLDAWAAERLSPAFKSTSDKAGAL